MILLLRSIGTEPKAYADAPPLSHSPQSRNGYITSFDRLNLLFDNFTHVYNVLISCLLSLLFYSDRPPPPDMSLLHTSFYVRLTDFNQDYLWTVLELAIETTGLPVERAMEYNDCLFSPEIVAHSYQGGVQPYEACFQSMPSSQQAQGNASQMPAPRHPLPSLLLPVFPLHFPFCSLSPCSESWGGANVLFRSKHMALLNTLSSNESLHSLLF